MKLKIPQDMNSRLVMHMVSMNDEMSYIFLQKSHEQWEKDGAQFFSILFLNFFVGQGKRGQKGAKVMVQEEKYADYSYDTQGDALRGPLFLPRLKQWTHGWGIDYGWLSKEGRYMDRGMIKDIEGRKTIQKRRYLKRKSSQLLECRGDVGYIRDPLCLRKEALHLK